MTFAVFFYSSYMISVKKGRGSAKFSHVRNNWSTKNKAEPFGLQKQHGKTSKDRVGVDVLYVASCHAKKVKNELDSLGYFDKRYKMVKAAKENVSEEGETFVENLIAIPVTQQCISYFTKVKQETSSALRVTKTNLIFVDLVVGLGTEKVPFSSSYIAKIRQNKIFR